MRQATRVLGVALLLAGSFAAFAQSQGKESQQADRQGSEATMTGCLSKDASGGYILADEKTGAKTMVTGTADLEKHSANHKVTLTGTSSEADGKSVFRVTKIQHVAAECKAPAQ